MSNSENQHPDSSLPAPLQFLVGLLQWLLGVVVAMIGGLLRAFAITAPIGVPLVKVAYKLSYNGGADMGAGLVGTFRLIGKGFSAGANAAAQHQTKKDEPPVK